MSRAIDIGACLFIALILCYLTIGAMIERYKWPGHEAAYTVIIGMLVSFFVFIVEANQGDEINEDNRVSILDMMKFDDNTFFYVCLPPLVFNSGFNMQRGSFFRNIGNVMIFGIGTTFFCFFVYSFLTIMATKMDLD